MTGQQIAGVAAAEAEADEDAPPAPTPGKAGAKGVSKGTGKGADANPPEDVRGPHASLAVRLTVSAAHAAGLPAGLCPQGSQADSRLSRTHGVSEPRQCADTYRKDSRGMEAAREGGISNAEQSLQTNCSTPGPGMSHWVRMPLQALQQQHTQTKSLCL